MSGAAGTYGYVRAHSLAADANAAHFESDAYSLGNQARTNITVANVAFTGAAVFAVAAAVVWLVSE
jgi:hypothetical protein